MDKNHQDKTGSKLTTTEGKIWLPPLSSKDQEKLDQLRKKPFAERMGFAGKTPWDLVQLLLIPLVLAGVGYWFSFTQAQTSLEISQKQHDNDQQLALDQQRETALKTYLDDISDLLLNHSLRKSKTGDEVRQIARARTLTTLERLDPKRKGSLLLFLKDADLIYGNSPIQTSIIELYSANLSYTDLSGKTLSFCDLSSTDLYKAELSHAGLHAIDLYKANLGAASVALGLLSRYGDRLEEALQSSLKQYEQLRERQECLEARLSSLENMLHIKPVSPETERIFQAISKELETSRKREIQEFRAEFEAAYQELLERINNTHFAAGETL